MNTHSWPLNKIITRLTWFMLLACNLSLHLLKSGLLIWVKGLTWELEKTTSHYKHCLADATSSPGDIIPAPEGRLR